MSDPYPMFAGSAEAVADAFFRASPSVWRLLFRHLKAQGRPFPWWWPAYQRTCRATQAARRVRDRKRGDARKRRKSRAVACPYCDTTDCGDCRNC